MDDLVLDLHFSSPDQHFDLRPAAMDLFTLLSNIDDTILAISGAPHDIGDVSLNTPSEQRRFRCPLCKTFFTEQRSLKRHLRTVSCTGQSISSKHHCSICNLMFARKDDCTRHEKLQHGDSRVKCSICDRKVARRGLSEHKRSRRCLQTVQTRTPSTIAREAIFDAGPPPVLPSVVIAWRVLDPWHILAEVIFNLQAGMEYRPSVFRSSTCHQPSASLIHNAWSHFRYLLDDAAMLEAKSLFLCVVAGNITNPSAHRDLLPWLQASVSIAVMLDTPGEAALHRSYLEPIQNRLSRGQTTYVRSKSREHCAAVYHTSLSRMMLRRSLEWGYPPSPAFFKNPPFLEGGFCYIRDSPRSDSGTSQVLSDTTSAVWLTHKMSRAVCELHHWQDYATVYIDI